MLTLLFNTMTNLLASLVQIICIPINALIESTMPDLSTQLGNVTTGLSSIFNSITWGLGLLPRSLIEILLFIILIEVAKHTIFRSTHMLQRVWHIIQKIKFW